MDKEKLNAKLGYNKELLEQLSNAFDLQEDYNDYGWDKLFEICRYIYNLEQQCKKQKEVIDKVRNNLEKDISVIKNVKMSNKEIICRLEETNKMLKEVSE